MRTGVFVDVAYLNKSGGFGMQFNVLRAYASRRNQTLQQMNAYVNFDCERDIAEPDYEVRSLDFQSRLRDFGFCVKESLLNEEVNQVADNSVYVDAPRDKTIVEMSLDILLSAPHLDHIIIVSGDGGLRRVVSLVRQQGRTVELIGFRNVDKRLRGEVDVFISGYVIPELLSVRREEGISKTPKRWGQPSSYVRGICYTYFADKHYGFVRFMKTWDGDLFLLDARVENSPYETVFLKGSGLPHSFDVGQLPSRDIVLEFFVSETARGFEALEVSVVCAS